MKADYLVILTTKKGERVTIHNTLTEAKDYLKENVKKDLYLEGVIYSKTWYCHKSKNKLEPIYCKG
jgi:hypothetical protein